MGKKEKKKKIWKKERKKDDEEEEVKVEAGLSQMHAPGTPHNLSTAVLHSFVSPTCLILHSVLLHSRRCLFLSLFLSFFSER